MLTADRLREVMHYDPETGIFTRDGKVAGAIYGDGYRRISIDGTVYLAHSLAFLFMTGARPKLCVNHRNDNRGDDRWSNLRLATKAQTLRTRKPANKLGIKGVQMTPGGNYRATITINYRSINLGTYLTAEGASQAYAEAALKHFGEFARQSKRRRLPFCFRH